MEFSSERSQPSDNSELETALRQNSLDIELELRRCLEAGELDAVDLSDDELFLVEDFCENLTEDDDDIDATTTKAAERAAKFAKLLYATATGDNLPALFTIAPGDDFIEVNAFITGVYSQSDTYAVTHPTTLEMLQRLNVELDFSGKHTDFMIALAELALISIEFNTYNLQIQAFDDIIDDELALFFGEAS